MKQLHPNSIIVFYVNGLIASVFLLGFVFFFPGMLLVGLAIEGTISFVWSIIFIIFSIAVIFILPLPWAQLSYQSFKYQLDDETIVIERGVIWKRHVSIPYQRVQNVDIVRGPIARMLGFADLQIQTAGISGVAIMEGRIPAITPEDAIELKDKILSKVAKSRNQGL